MVDPNAGNPCGGGESSWKANQALESLVMHAQQSSPESCALLRSQLSEVVAMLSAQDGSSHKQQHGEGSSKGHSVEVATGGSTRRVTPARSRTAHSVSESEGDDGRRRWGGENLSPCIIHALFSNLDAISLCRAMSVSHSWRLAARDERLWMWLHLNSSGLPKPSIIPPCSWRADYSNRMWLRKNWLVGRCLVTRLTGHREAVNCFASHGDLIVSGADDNDLRVWDLEKPADQQCTRVLEGHTGKVLCCCIVRGFVFSGGEDKIVMVWEVKTGQLVAQMRQHVGAVLCMVTDGHRYVYTGGADYELCKWSVATKQCEGVMRKHRAPILCMSLGCEDAYVVTGSRDRDACVWNTSLAPTTACVMTLSGHEAAITCIHASRQSKGLAPGAGDGGVIVTGSDDKTARLWATGTGHCLKVVHEHQGPLSCVMLLEGRIITACFDGNVRFFDVLTGRCIRTVTGHRNAVISLDARGSFVVTGGNDRDLRVWDMEARSSVPSSQVLASANRVTISIACAEATAAEGTTEETETGYALQGHNSGIQKVMIVGERIVTASDDYDLRVWDFARWPKEGSKQAGGGKTSALRRAL